MKGEYKTLNDISLESNVLFFGKESCLPNYYFTGNNVRKNYVIHYILKGKGVFPLQIMKQFNLKLETYLFCLRGFPVFIKQTVRNPGHTFGLDYLA